MIDPLLLHAYADGELTADERAQIEAQLRSCPDSQGELRMIQSVKHLLATCPEVTADPASWVICRERLDQLDRAHRTERFVGRYAWAMAAGIVGLISVTGIVRRNNPADRMEGADLARIMSQFGTSSSRLSPTASLEQGQAEMLLRRARLVVDPTAVRVIAVSEVVEDGMVMRRVLLRDAKGPMALLDLPESVRVDGLSPMPDSAILAGKVDQMPCVAWPCGGRQLLLVGPRGVEALSRVAQAIHVAR